jgi:hypothetical protein
VGSSAHQDDSLWSRLSAAEERLERERRQAPILVARLAAANPIDRMVCLADPEFQTWGVGELLVAASEEACDIDLPRAEQLAHLALALVATLYPPNQPAALIEDLRARGWAALGEVKRRKREFDAAEEALHTAARALVRGTGDLLVEARLLEFEARLRLDGERPLEAESLLRQASSRLRQAGEFEQWQRITALRAAILERVRAVRARGGLVE